MRPEYGDPNWRPLRNGAVRTQRDAAVCSRCGQSTAKHDGEWFDAPTVQLVDGEWFHCEPCGIYWRVEAEAFDWLYISPNYVHSRSDCRCKPTRIQEKCAA